MYCSFFFSSRRRHTRFDCDWSSDVCSSDLGSSLVREHSGRVVLYHLDLYRLEEPEEDLPAIGYEAFFEPEDRSEERRVGKERRSRWSSDGQKEDRQGCRIHAFIVEARVGYV